MRKFTVDFKTPNIGTVGRKGEHNYPVLEFLLDEDFQNCDFIIIQFGINGKKIPTDSIKPTGETLTFKLTQQLTKAGHHHVQLVGYVVDAETAEPQEIMKSPVVHFCIEQSISGTEQEADSNPSLLDRILTKVHALLEKAHSHNNKRTIDKFLCDLAEAEGSEFPILPDHVGADRVKYNGIYLAYCSDGGVIGDTEEWNDPETNEKFFRIHLNNGPLNTGKRDWIDIPISGTKEVTDSDAPDIGTQSVGVQLQLGGSGSTKTIPIVTALPETAKEGDVVMYKPAANTFTQNDSGKTVYMNYGWIESYVGDYFFGQAYSESKKYGEIAFVVECNPETAITITYSAEEPAHNTLYGTLFWNFNSDENRFVFDSLNSVGNNINGEAVYFTEPPEKFILFNDIISEPTTDGFEKFPHTVFYIKPEFYVFKSGAWNKLYFVPTKTSELDADAFYDRIEDANATVLQPNKEYAFGEVATLTLDFAEGIAGKRNEYLFSFISGETPTVLTLPSSVKWVNELTVEANKRYEISVVDNVALWCAVDMAVSE